jgi:putative acyl-CoA dehydrogenase
MCMDARRAMRKDASTIDALFDELRPLRGQDARFDAQVVATERLVSGALDDEFLARPMTEAVARSLQAAELMRHSTPDVANAFLATRCPGAAGAWGSMFGTLGATIDKAQADRIVERALVAR